MGTIVFSSRGSCPPEGDFLSVIQEKPENLGAVFSARPLFALARGDAPASSPAH